MEKLLDKIVDLLVICPLKVSGRCQFCSGVFVFVFVFGFVLVLFVLSKWFECFSAYGCICNLSLAVMLSQAAQEV